MSRRSSHMKRLLTPLILSIALLAVACGGEPSEVSSDATGGETSAQADPQPVEPDGGIGDGADPLPSSGESDAEEPDVTGSDETVITDNDMVDPRFVAPTEVVVNPDDATQLWVRFVGGDPNCTAADAIVLTETPTDVAVELMVGITQDALTRSCVAADFNLRVDVQLNESADGKTISWTQPASDEAPLVTPDLSTDDFIGLSQADAEALADENLIPSRVGRIDGEFFALTEDFNPGRLTFEIDGGIVTSAVLG